MKIFKEPLLHFLLIGAFFFALYIWLNPDNGRGDQYILVDEGRISALSENFRRTWNRAPTDAELKSLIDDFVVEEIYYRQALAMGIDKNDPLIRRRLRQKMEFLASSVATSVEPTNEDLSSYLASHKERYMKPARLGFEQIYINPDRYPDSLEARVKEVESALQNDRPVESDQTMLDLNFSNAADFQVDRDFGQNFASKIAKLPLNRWSGPVRSGLGIHFIKLIEYEPSTLPPLNEVKELVLRDWTYDNEQLVKKRLRDELLAEYRVEIRWPEGKVGGVNG